jgi:hypothetical protein
VKFTKADHELIDTLERRVDALLVENKYEHVLCALIHELITVLIRDDPSPNDFRARYAWLIKSLDCHPVVEQFLRRVRA